MNQIDIDRLEHQIEILQQLDHPNILKLFEFYDQPKYFFLVTELCSGGDLYDEMVFVNKFSQKNAAQIITQILEAIAYCHKQGIIHRNLKPECILFDSKNRYNIKIFDFRIAQHIDQLKTNQYQNKKLQYLHGTSYYIAPEVLLNDYDESCDMWSIGVILYMMIFGKAPFDGEDDFEIIKKVRSGIYDTMEIPEFKNKKYNDCKNLIKQLLSFDPKRRISAIEALRHPWITQYNVKKEGQISKLTYVLKNLKNYNTVTKLQEACISYMVKLFIEKKNLDIDDIQLVFKQLDTENAGKLSKENLIKGYEQIYQNKKRAVKIVNRIFQKLDQDQVESLDYGQFLVATINKDKLFTEEKLRQMFELFDKDKGGSISADEVKDMLCQQKNIDDNVWLEIIKEVDEDGSGELDYEEFVRMMKTMVNYDSDDEADKS